MIEQITAWAEAHIATSSELAYVGAAAAILAGLFVAWSAFGAVKAFMRTIANWIAMRGVSKDKTPGFRILLASAGSGRAARFVRRALTEHLERFSFGAPFRLCKAGRLPSDPAKAERAARSRLRRSDADMILWVERTSGRADGLKIRSISRGGGMSVAEAPLKTSAASGAHDRWSEDFAVALAYQLAKELQPALSQPESFRPERVRTIAEELNALLNGDAGLSKDARSELEDDFCAAALHVAEAGDDIAFVDTVIERRRAFIGATEGRTAEQVQARLDLGRALLAKATRAFDPSLVREAMTELELVAASMRGDLSIRRATQASDAVTRGQALLETRKRFQLNFGS